MRSDRERRRLERTVDDADLGTIAWRVAEEGWCVRAVIDGERVEVRLAGSRAAGPTAEARARWLAAGPTIEEVWTTVVGFARDWAGRAGAPLDIDDVVITGLHVAPGEPHESGDLVFFFEIVGDPDGLYTVPVRDGAPLRVQRDG